MLDNISKFPEVIVLKYKASCFMEAWSALSREIKRASKDSRLHQDWDCVDWQSAVEVYNIAKAIKEGRYDT